jgi:SAM-dependent methyltransferase
MLPQIERSNQTYDSDFCTYYDRITSHKDYQAEINTLAHYIRSAVRHPNPKLLDVGCGTGNHAALLAEEGYDITAIDLSPDMIRVAKSKNVNVNFECGDIAHAPPASFDFCYSLFNVINCLDTMENLISFFREIFARLADGGGLLLESWNPIAVIATPPETVQRTFDYENERIVRTVVPQPDFLNQRLDLKYQIDVYGTGGHFEKVKSFTVVHHLLLFTPLEIEYSLKQAGFGKIKIHTALPEMAPATASDRMLAFTCEK